MRGAARTVHQICQPDDSSLYSYRPVMMLKRPLRFEAWGVVEPSPDGLPFCGGHARLSCDWGSDADRLPWVLGPGRSFGVATTLAAGSGLDPAGICGVRGEIPSRTSSAKISASTSVSFEICVLATEAVVAAD